MITSLIPSFNSGELSPLIHLRSDLDKYRSGCRTLENMLITPYGGVQRRAGFAYVGTAQTKCRLFRFQVSVSLGYVLEMGEEYIRFYRDAGPVQLDGIDYEVASPYLEADLAELQMVQINSVAYFTHPSFPVYKLVRFANSEWQFAEVDFSYPAMLDENLVKSRKIETMAAGLEGDTIILKSNFDLFEEDHVGASFQISHERKESEFEVKLRAIAANDGVASASIIVQGGWSVTTSGTWDGAFQVQRSDDGGGSWKTIRRLESDSDANYSVGGDEPSRVLLRLRWIHGATGSSGPRATLEAVGAFVRGVVKITSVTSRREAQALVTVAVEAGDTSYWREGAWSAVQGYPRTVVAHEQRIVFGGTASSGQTIWASAVDDYENFEPGVEDSDSWTHAMASDQNNDIQWLVSQKSLIIGTSGDEWVLGSSKEESIITPTNVRARRHSGNGSTYLKARLVNESILFVQRGGRKLRDMQFSFEADGYVTSDLTLLAEHITGAGGIIDTAYQSQPIGTLWCITGGGELLGLTYDKGQQIVGWHRHTTGNAADGFESVAVKATTGEADQVWVVARRTINGTVRRYIERLGSPEGFFLETPWSEQFGDTYGIPIWNTQFESYEAGFVGYAPFDSPWVDGEGLYIALVDHEMDATYEGSDFTDHVWLYDDGTAPEGRTWCRIYNWATGEGTSSGWGVDQLCYHNGSIYRCILGHTDIPTDPDREPGVGIDTATYWALESALPDPPPEIALGTPYSADFEVTLDGKIYVSQSLHTPLDSNKPGVGASWETFWTLSQGTYSIGDLVSVDGLNYVCTAAHTPAALNKPGSGADWGDFWSVQTADNLLFFVDSGVSKFDVTLSEFDGLDHLEGETVQVVGNGEVLAERVVSGGKILFTVNDPSEFTSVSVGLQYDSILEPMALEVGMQNGTSVGREKRIHELVIFFQRSSGCKVSSKLTGTFDTLPFRMADMVPSDVTPLYTGALTHMLDQRHDLLSSFVIKQDLPLPMQILAVVPKFNIYGDQS